MWSIQIIFGTTNKSKYSQINILIWITSKLNLQDSDSRLATLHDICQIFNESLQFLSKRFPIGWWTNFQSILAISVVEVFHWKCSMHIVHGKFLLTTQHYLKYHSIIFLSPLWFDDESVVEVFNWMMNSSLNWPKFLEIRSAPKNDFQVQRMSSCHCNGATTQLPWIIKSIILFYHCSSVLSPLPLKD